MSGLTDKTVPFADILAEQLQDPEFRAEWERTALARAVANCVIKYRVDQQLSQEELAARLGLKLSAVANLEDGDLGPEETTDLILETIGAAFSRLDPKCSDPVIAAARTLDRWLWHEDASWVELSKSEREKLADAEAALHRALNRFDGKPDDHYGYSDDESDQDLETDS